VRATGASRLYLAGIATNHVVEHGARQQVIMKLGSSLRPSRR